MPPRGPEILAPAPALLAFDDLPALFPGFDDPERWLPLLRRHLELVEAAAERVRVTSVAPADAVRRHYAESLELLRLAGPFEGSVCDIGSGGGYPGMIVAAVLPGTLVHLVEPLRKRASLLTEMAAELRLENVSVHALRAEEAGRGPLRNANGLVFARAVAELRLLLEYTAPVASVGATIALPKGSRGEGELAAAGNAMSELQCEYIDTVRMRDEVNSAVTIVRLRQLAPVPAKYPRRPGMPERRPL